MLLGTSHIGRYIFWNYADIDDYKKFPSVLVSKPAVPFYFAKSSENNPPGLPEKFQDPSEKLSFNDFLEEHETVAFMIIQNDTIKFENYFDGYSAGEMLMSFSISKSVLSALVGIALQEDYIRSIDQPVTDYLKGFKHEGFENITIRNLLEMLECPTTANRENSHN